MSKRWYNLFVSVDQAAEGAPDSAQSPDEAGATAAQAVAEIAASVPQVTQFSGRVANPTSFEEIYDSAEIHPPQHGYTDHEGGRDAPERAHPRPAGRSAAQLHPGGPGGRRGQDPGGDRGCRQARPRAGHLRAGTGEILARPGGRQDRGEPENPGRDGTPGGRVPCSHPGQRRRGSQGEGALLRLAPSETAGREEDRRRGRVLRVGEPDHHQRQPGSAAAAKRRHSSRYKEEDSRCSDVYPACFGRFSGFSSRWPRTRN